MLRVQCFIQGASLRLPKGRNVTFISCSDYIRKPHSSDSLSGIYFKYVNSSGNILVQVIACFVLIFGINTTSDILKLLCAIETILKYHKWYLCLISRTNHVINCLYYYPWKVCNFHMQVFQIKVKYHCSKPTKLQKFLMQQYNGAKFQR